MEKNKKLYMMIGGGIAAAVVIVAGIFLFLNSRAKPEDALLAFVEKLNAQEYASAYEDLSTSAQARYDKDTFVTRNTNIYAGTGASDIQVKITDTTKYGDSVEVTYHQKMATYAGVYEFDHAIIVAKEDGAYKLVWDSSFIFPNLSDEDKVSVSVDSGARGEIYDRNGNLLAQNGTALQVGVVPGSFNGQETKTFQTLADTLGIKVSTIETALQAGWVQDGLFVPIKTIAGDSDIRATLNTLGLPGVQIREVDARVYPYHEIAAHLTGYVHMISAEELEANKDKGYDETSIIGETGLEAIYEDTLRGKDGYTINIVSNTGVASEVISSKAVNGSDVHTTIDIALQTSAYQKLSANNDSGVLTAMNPTTGEVLALVSAPAYDPNDFVLGMDNDTWNALNENALHPLNNRFVSAFTPGSTFKAITSGIALDNKAISADEDMGKIDNWKWQADSSWGDYYITTTTPYSEPSNMVNALKYSDNLYFARLATKLGVDAMQEGMNKLGFNSTISFPFTLTQSTFGADGKLADGSTLADTGFGQGKLQLNPLHLTALYSAFANDGNIMQPYLDQADEKKQTVWLNQAFTTDSANTIYTDLTEVMKHYGVNLGNYSIGGKTGTAEVGDEQLGWLCVVSKDAQQPLAISLMVENTKEKGSSAYAYKMMMEILSETLQ